MSVIVFELREEHIKLLRFLKWSLKDVKVREESDWSESTSKLIVNVSEHDGSSPFDENNIYDAIDIILNGKPENFEPFETFDIKEYSREQKEAWDRLYSELPMALDIIMYNGNFQTGTYVSRYNQRDWVKNNHYLK